MSYSSYGDHKPANALLSSLPTPPPHNNISSTTIDSNRSYTASASAINRTDPFSRLLSSLDEPTFDSAGISGEDSVEDRLAEQRRLASTSNNSTSSSLHSNNNYDNGHRTQINTAKVHLTGPEAHSLRTTAVRSQAVSDRLRNELEDVRNENALLATRYSTLITKLQKTSDLALQEERNVLLSRVEHKTKMRELSNKLKKLEEEKLTLDSQLVELNTLKETVTNLKKEHGAQIFVNNQKNQEITSLKKDLISEKEKNIDL